MAREISRTYNILYETGINYVNNTYFINYRLHAAYNLFGLNN